jgi:hypothetical protein
MRFIGAMFFRCRVLEVDGVDQPVHSNAPLGILVENIEDAFFIDNIRIDSLRR